MRGREAPPGLVLTDLSDAASDDLVPEGRLDAVRVSRDQAAGQDVRGSRFLEVHWDGATLDATDFTGARFIDNRFTDVASAALKASGSTWRNVEMIGSRIGAVELDRAELMSVRLDRCKLDYVNLRYATVRDLTVADCQIDELDLAFASLEHVGFDRCRIGKLSITSATLAAVDLRGADLDAVSGVQALAGSTISPAQLAQLAPALADHLGIEVE